METTAPTWSAQMSLAETLESRTAVLNPIRDDLRDKLDKAVHDRQVFNLAVVLAGLEFPDKGLKEIFGDVFVGEMAALKAAIYENRENISVSVMSEAAKALNDMSLMSRTEAPDSEFALRESDEYIVGEGYIEIQMRESFVKYFACCKRKGFNPLYSNADSFMSAMAKSPAGMERVCFGSKLRPAGVGLSKIFRFDLEQLTAERGSCQGVQPRENCHQTVTIRGKKKAC